MDDQNPQPNQDATSDEEEYEPYFRHSASLRVFGPKVDLESITETLGVEPTHSHRKGEPKKRAKTVWSHDMWLYTVDVNREKPLGEHLDALWEVVRPHLDYLKDLKNAATVDVFLGYRSDCDHAGVVVPHTSLTILTELEVPLSLSIIVT